MAFSGQVSIPVGPEEADREFHGLGIPERHNPASQAAVALPTMTCSALLRKNSCAFFGGSASGRQFFSVRADRDVPGLDFLFAWSGAQLIRASLCRGHDTSGDSDHCGEKTTGIAHFARSRRGSPSRAERH